MVMKEIEKKLGLPSLAQVTGILEKFPDEKRLTIIKDVLEIAERVSRNAIELEKVIELVTELNSVPIEKLEKLEKVLKRIEGIVKKAPEQLLDFLSSLKDAQ